MRFLAVLTVKNEGAFLLEWLAHHLAVGFTDFLVFSNDCDDGTDRMLDRLAEIGRIVHIPNPGPWPRGPQWAALKRAETHPALRAADWAISLDIDEFVNIHAGAGRLDDLLAALPKADAIPLTWRLFGNCGVVGFTDTPVTACFPGAAPARMLWPWRAVMFKTLFRNNGRYRKLGVHRPRNPDPDHPGAPRWFDGSGRELPAAFLNGRVFSVPGQDNYRFAQINHYALGAMESYVLKCDRGRANRDASAFDLSYWVERNFCSELDATIRRYDEATAQGVAELHADPVLGPLHAAAVAWRHDRFTRLMLEEPFRALFGRLMLTPPSLPLSAEGAARMTKLGLRAREATQETN